MATPAAPAARTTNVLSLTLETYIDTMADNISTGTPFCEYMDQRGRINKQGGKTVDAVVLMKLNPNVAARAKGDSLSTTDEDNTTVASYKWGEINTVVSLSDADVSDNTGDRQIFDLVSTKMKAAEIELKQQLSSQIMSVATTPSSKGFNGLGHLIGAPVTQSVGGITPNTSDSFDTTFWQPQTIKVRTKAYSYTAFRKDAVAAQRQCTVNHQFAPDLMLMDLAEYGELEDQAWAKTQLEGAGGMKDVDFVFPRLMVGSLMVMWDDTIQTFDTSKNTNTIWILNTDFLEIVANSNRWGDKKMGIRDANMAYEYHQIAFRGQLITNMRRCQGIWNKTVA